MTKLLLIAATERELCDLPNLETSCCGIGPVEAALGTAISIAQHRPDAVLHVGIAGASSLDAGSIVIGTESVYSDVLAPNTTLPRVARVTPSMAMFDVACAALPEAVTLPIATTARVGGSSDHEVEAMEGFGVLRAAALAGVPALEVRAISNNPTEIDRGRWQIERALAVLHAATTTLAPALISLLH